VLRARAWTWECRQQQTHRAARAVRGAETGIWAGEDVGDCGPPKPREGAEAAGPTVRSGEHPARRPARPAGAGLVHWCPPVLPFAPDAVPATSQPTATEPEPRPVRVRRPKNSRDRLSRTWLMPLPGASARRHRVRTQPPHRAREPTLVTRSRQSALAVLAQASPQLASSADREQPQPSEMWQYRLPGEEKGRAPTRCGRPRFALSVALQWATMKPRGPRPAQPHDSKRMRSITRCGQGASHGQTSPGRTAPGTSDRGSGGLLARDGLFDRHATAERVVLCPPERVPERTGPSGCLSDSPSPLGSPHRPRECELEARWCSS